uniref:Uncharacterized protein n=1 Tax=Arundo donax TaxID=35708 RepID=A0A0A9BEQ5_ARUDO
MFSARYFMKQSSVSDILFSICSTDCSVTSTCQILNLHFRQPAETEDIRLP